MTDDTGQFVQKQEVVERFSRAPCLQLFINASAKFCGDGTTTVGCGVRSLTGGSFLEPQPTMSSASIPALVAGNG